MRILRGSACRLSGTVLLIALFLSPMAVLSAEEGIADGELNGLVATALANNPELKASEARWRMFEARVSRAGSLDDPMLTLKIQNGIISDPFNFRKDSMTQKVVGISQQLPFWGKRGLREEVAAREAESYRWTLEERKLELKRLVKEAWYQLYYIDKSLVIVARNIRILDDFITIAETRYSVGRGVQQDIFKAQVERSRLLDTQITLEQQRRSAQANMNTLLYRPTETPIGKIPDITLQPLQVGDEYLRKTAFENRPLLKSLNALIEKGKAGNKLAHKEFYPDLNVSFEYMQRDPAMDQRGLDMYSLGLTFNLPVQRARRQAAVVEADSETRMATEEFNNLRNSISYSIADLMAQMERRRKQIDLYRTGIIPQAAQSLESATVGYRVSKVDFLTLLDSRVTLFNYEKEYYESMADYQIRRAQLEALVGKELP